MVRKTELSLTKTPQKGCQSGCLLYCVWKKIKSKTEGTFGEFFYQTYASLNLPIGYDFSDTEIEKICELTNISLKVYFPFKSTSPELKMIISKKKYGKGETYKLLRINNHYDIIVDSKYFKKGLCKICNHWNNLQGEHWKICIVCPKCGRQTTVNAEHIRDCSGKKKSFKKVVDKPIPQAVGTFTGVFEPIKTYTIARTDVSFKHNVHFADFECFVPLDDPTRNYIVYAAAIVSIDSRMPWDHRGKTFPTYRVFMGDNALEEFIDYLMTLKGVVYFWNGAAFDAFFIVRYLLKKNLPIYSKKMVINNNRIVTMNISPNLKVRDLMLYIAPMSLANACKGFSVPDEYTKGEFDHSLIHSFEDVNEHAEEIKKYLRNDILAMLFIYKSYANEIYRIFGANLTSAMTLSHMSYMIWSSMLVETFPALRMYKLPIQEYKKIIPGYYGGRVILQQQVWENEHLEAILLEAELNQGYVSHETFESIKKYLVKLDVVSLYPSVMQNNFYPTGKWKFIDITDENRDRYFTILKSLHAEATHRRMIVCVDVDCPDDIYVPFLMSRENNKLKQDLHPKKEQVYYAVELVHAIRLGYVLKKIYWIMMFETSHQIFKNYINKFWEMKSSSKKGTAKYLAAKGTGNALSGKFGQIEHEISTKIMSIDEFTEDMDILGYETIVEDDEIVGIIYSEKNEKEFTTYPSYTSLCILAMSRIAMSKTMLEVDGYKNPEMTPLYGDTDSLIISSEALTKISNLGNNLGDIDDEFAGGKIIQFVGLAPKTYNTVYVSSKCVNGKHEVLSSTRCKGIPHTADSVNIFQKQKDKQAILDEVLNFKANADFGAEIPIEKCGVKDVIYSIEIEGEEPITVNHIGAKEMIAILNKEVKIKVYYRSIRRTMRQNGDRTAISVSSSLSERQIYASDWWANNEKRNKPTSLYTISTPKGFMSF